MLLLGLAGLVKYYCFKNSRCSTKMTFWLKSTKWLVEPGYCKYPSNRDTVGIHLLFFCTACAVCAVCTMADLQRILEIESDKLDRWCKDNGVESSTDLAFYFLTYQEALDAAGRVVADAWARARSEAAPGLAVGARGALRVEQARPSSMPSRPKASPSLQPSAAPRSVAKGGSLPASAYRRPGDDKAPVEDENQLLAIMLAASPHRPSSVGEQSALRSFVVSVASKCEPVTLRNALRTWQELRTFASGIKIDMVELSALQLATFIQTSDAATRAYNSLHWLVRNFEVGLRPWSGYQTWEGRLPLGLVRVVSRRLCFLPLPSTSWGMSSTG